jgi:hypothetical protein
MHLCLYHSVCSVAVNELARYCNSYPQNKQSFNSTDNEVKLLFHSDDYSVGYHVSRGFSLRFNTSQNGKLNMLHLFICFPLNTRVVLIFIMLSDMPEGKLFYQFHENLI